MKMLLASDDIAAVHPLAKRLVASGIPIALQKPVGLPTYLEVWVQRDRDFSLARTMLPPDLFAPVAPPASAAAGPEPSGATRTGDSVTVSGICRLVHWFHH